jgi:error-prone DNA polymerase
LEKLARANGLRSLSLLRRQALWELSRTDPPIGLFVGKPAAEAEEEKVILPRMTAGEHVLQDYAATSLSLEAHPVSFVREKLQQLRIVTTAQLLECKDGDYVKCAGLVLVRQRPGTASGVVFITIEDETGIANLVVWRTLFDQYRKPILQSRLLMVEGKLQREGEVMHVVVQKCYNLNQLLRGVMAGSEPVQMDVFDKGRNFK